MLVLKESWATQKIRGALRSRLVAEVQSISLSCSFRSLSKEHTAKEASPSLTSLIEDSVVYKTGPIITS